MKKKPLTTKSGEVRPLSRATVRSMRPAAKALPPKLVAVLPKRRAGQRGPQRAPTKEQVTLRLDADILDFFKSFGPGWQTRLNDTLKGLIEKR